MHRCECDPTAERERRLDLDSVERHMQIRSRQAVAVDLAADCCGLSEFCIHLLPIDGLCMGDRDEWFREDLPINRLRGRRRRQ
jgi:hypothetical protein